MAKKRRVLSNKRRRMIATLITLTLAGLVFWQKSELRPTASTEHSAPPTSQDQARYHEKEVKVVRVIDGDTLDIDIPDGKYDTTRIRLWGVDTPETQNSKFGEMAFGPEASQFTRTLTQGKTVRIALEPYQKSRDKYGRLLAYIFLENNTMLNEQLIAQGMGYADERFDHIYRRRFLQHQKQAQKEDFGLWKSTRPHQWPQWYRRRHAPDYQK